MLYLVVQFQRYVSASSALVSSKISRIEGYAKYFWWKSYKVGW